MQNTDNEPKDKENPIIVDEGGEIVDEFDEKEEEVFGENLKTFNDFAKECGRTYETIRKRVKDAEDVLGKHIVYNPKTKTRYLDSFAQEYLRNNSAMDYIQLNETSAADEVKALQAKCEELTDKYQTLLEKQNGLMERLVETSRIEAEHRFQIEKNEELTEKTKELESKIEELQAENAKFEKCWSLFGVRYKKKEDK